MSALTRWITQKLNDKANEMVEVVVVAVTHTPWTFTGEEVDTMVDQLVRPKVIDVVADESAFPLTAVKMRDGVPAVADFDYLTAMLEGGRYKTVGSTVLAKSMSGDLETVETGPDQAIDPLSVGSPGRVGFWYVSLPGVLLTGTRLGRGAFGAEVARMLSTLVASTPDVTGAVVTHYRT